MLASLTAFDVLAGVLVVGLIAALAGYAGGAGALLRTTMHLNRVEGAVLAYVNRVKGGNGGAQAQAQRQRVSNAEREAEALAQQLAQRPRRRGGLRLPAFLTGPQNPADAAEDESFAELDVEQQRARAAATKPS